MDGLKRPQVALRRPVRGLGWVPLRRHRREAVSFRPAAMWQWRWVRSRLHTLRRGGFRKGHNNLLHHPRSLRRPPQRSLLQPKAHYHHRQRLRRQQEFQVRQRRHPRRLQRRKLESQHRPRRVPVQRHHQLWIWLLRIALKRKQRRLWVSRPIGHSELAQEEHWKLRQLPLHRGTVCR